MMAWLIVSRASALECVENLSREELSERITTAEQAFVAVDEAAFRDRLNELAGIVVPCMGDLVPPELSARYHRLMAVHLDGLGDADNAALSARAAHQVAPGAGFDDSWLGPGHPVRVAFEQATDAGRTRDVPAPRSGSVAFDGTNTRARPVDRPSLVQVFDASGVARATAYVGPNDALPAYDVVPVKRIALSASAGLSVVAGGVLLGLATGQQAALLELASDPRTPADALTAKRAAANTLAVAGSALVGVSVGLGAGAVLVGPR